MVPFWKLIPSTLYVNPKGEVMVIVPVDTVQVGCTTVVVATAGAIGAALSVTGTDCDVHPPVP